MRYLLRSWSPPLFVAAMLLAVPTTFAQRREPDQPALRPDFQLQGEYVGEATLDDSTQKVGIQVIALGDGQFEAVGYIGGLPGDGWDGEEPHRATGRRNDSGSVTFRTEEATARLESGRIEVQHSDGSVVCSLKKVERKSPTLGEKPPQGAVVLFDGTSTAQWEPGRKTDDGLLMQGATSVPKFQSHRLHIEFQLPFEPEKRGQARGNSGIYLQGRYEVQMLDSFGLTGENNECGGIYEIRAPEVNMCFPPLAWQTYDIEFHAAEYNDQGEVARLPRITVRHNGVLVHDDVELPRSTRAAPNRPGPEPGPVYLQDHGSPVRYRNIWVVPLES